MSRRFPVPLNGYDAQFCQCGGEDEECPICFPFVCDSCENRVAKRFACFGCLRWLCEACWRGKLMGDGEPWCFDCLHPTCACGALLVFQGSSTPARCDDCESGSRSAGPGDRPLVADSGPASCNSTSGTTPPMSPGLFAPDDCEPPQPIFVTPSAACAAGHHQEPTRKEDSYPVREQGRGCRSQLGERMSAGNPVFQTRQGGSECS